MNIPQVCRRVEICHVYARGLLVIMASALLMPPALAQTAAPARDANRWNDIDHQPTRAALAAQERQAGIALSDEQKRQEDEDLGRIASRLLQNAAGEPQ